MNAGQMRSRIRLLQKAAPEPATPHVSVAGPYELVATVRAKKEDSLTKSIWGAAAENAVNAKQFIVRYRNGVTAGMRVEYGVEVFVIKATAELGNNRQWLVMLVERVDNIEV